MPSVSKIPAVVQMPSTNSATPPPARLKRRASHAKALSKRCGRRCSSCQIGNVNDDWPAESALPPFRSASCCGSLTGSERSSKLFTSEKIAVLAPMPSASDRTATMVTTGVPASWRMATRMSCTYPPPRRARGRFDSSRNDAAFSVSSAICRASASDAPSRIAAACSSARWHASSSTTSSESSRHSRFARSRTSAFHCRRSRSRITDSSEIPNQLEEQPPFLALRREHFAAFGRDLVITPAPLPRLLDPAALDPFAFFELVEGCVERCEVEGERAAGAILDQLRQLVAVPRFIVEKCEHDELRRALLRFADGAGEFHGAGVYSGVRNIVKRGGGAGS